MAVSLLVTESALLYTQLMLFTPDCAISHYLLAFFIYSSLCKPKNSLLYCIQDYKRNQFTVVIRTVIDPRVKGQMQIVSALCVVMVCKPGFAKLTVDYSEDQRSQRIALSAVNNAFGVHSDHVQDIVLDSCELGT